jgi:hypothetical protein
MTGPRRVRTVRLVSAIALVVGAWWPVGGADAAIGGFNVSPGSGPAGTTVTVNGTGCSPGLVNNAQDYVTIAAVTVPPTTFNVSVASNGSWSDDFAIPSLQPTLAVAITAVCFTNGLPSLTTIYTPQTFTVTDPAPSPTTAPPTASTAPTTAPPDDSSPPTTPTVTDDDDNPASGNDGNDGRTGNDGRDAPGSGGNDDGTTPATDPVTGAPIASGSDNDGTAGTAGNADASDDARMTGAALDAPELTAVHERGGPGRLSWFIWLLLAAAAGAIALYAWLRHARPEPVLDDEPEA